MCLCPKSFACALQCDEALFRHERMKRCDIMIVCLECISINIHRNVGLQQKAYFKTEERRRYVAHKLWERCSSHTECDGQEHNNRSKECFAEGIAKVLLGLLTKASDGTVLSSRSVRYFLLFRRDGSETSI